MSRTATILTLGLAFCLPSSALLAAPSDAEWEAMKALVQQQQQKIDALEKIIDGKASAASTTTATGGAKTAGGAAAPMTPTPSSASGSPDALLTADWKDINFDRPISEVPAFAALDVSPNTVDHPTTPRQLAASVLNGVDRNGVLQTGLAIEVAPFQVFPPWQNYNITEYNEKTAVAFLKRALYNTSLSLATTKATDDKDKAERLALGVHIVFFDDSDPRTYGTELVQKSVDQHSVPVPRFGQTEAQNGAAESPEEAATTKDFASLAAQWAKTHWAQNGWDLAWAPMWLSESGNADDLRSDGSAVWSTYGLGFTNDPFSFHSDNRLQLLIQARYREGEHVTDPNDPTRKGVQDTFIAAGRLRYGTADLNASFEGAYLRTRGGIDGDGNAFRYSVGLERKIASNLWFTISTGQELGGGKANNNALFAIGAFRFGTSDTPNLDPESGPPAPAQPSPAH